MFSIRMFCLLLDLGRVKGESCLNPIFELSLKGLVRFDERLRNTCLVATSKRCDQMSVNSPRWLAEAVGIQNFMVYIVVIIEPKTWRETSLPFEIID